MVNASDCGSEDRGFESLHSPHFPSWDCPILGCRQVVRHQTLTLAFVGSSPAIPAMSEQGVLCSDFIFSPDPLAQLAEQLPFKQWVWSSNLQRVTTAILNKAPEKSIFSGALAFPCLLNKPFSSSGTVMFGGIAFFISPRSFSKMQEQEIVCNGTKNDV